MGTSFLSSLSSQSLLGSTLAQVAGATFLVLGLSASCGDVGPKDVAPSVVQTQTRTTPSHVSAFRRTDGGFVTSSGHWNARVTDLGGIELAARGAAGPALLLLETVGIGRDASMPVSAGPVVPARGGMTIGRGDVIERIDRIDRGVEQSWRFDAMPSGSGPLEVVVAVHGAEHAGEDDDGLRFVDARHGARFRYGHATWVDASGHRTAVPTVASGSTVTMTVSHAVLASSAFPAVLDPTVEAEIELDPASVYVAAAGAQYVARAASDGVDGVVVWTDEREGPRKTYGTGIDDTGSAYQRANVRLDDQGLGDQRIAYLRTETNGDRHYVLAATNQFDVILIPVVMTSTGDISAGDPLTVFTAPPQSNAGVLDVAASVTGGHFLVVFHVSSETGSSARVQVFSAADYTALTTPVVLYTISDGVGYQARATFASTHYLVAGRGEGGDPLSAFVVDPATGTATATHTISNGENPSEPSIAFNGQDAFVSYVLGDGNLDVYGRRLDENGVGPVEINLTPVNEPQYRPHVIPGTALANDFVVLWQDDRSFEGELWAATVSSSNGVTAVPSTTGVGRPQGTSIAGTAFAVYHQGTEDEDVYSRGFNSAWLTATLLSEQANRQTDTAVDIAGTTGLVAWADDRNDNHDVFAIAVDDTGAPTGTLITVSTNSEPEGEIDVATGSGGESVVVWRRGEPAPPDGSDTAIVAALVDASGTVVDEEILASGGANAFPRVLFDGTSYLVTWQLGEFDCEGGPCLFVAQQPQLRSLTASATSITPGATVAALERGLAPTLGQSPDGSLLWVWEHDGDISATVLSGGMPGSTIVVSSEPGRQSRPAVAMDDDVALIVYEDDREGGSQLFAALMDSANTVTLLGSISGDIESREPEVVDAADGYSFLVVWDGSAFGAPEQVWGAWVKKDGTKVDAIPRRLTDNLLGASRRPDITPLAAGRMLVSLDAVSAERSARASTMVVDSGQVDGTICDVPDQCASRFCADGVCCTEPCSGLCRQCGADGICQAVTLVEDDSCFGTEKCSEDGECLRNDGETCDDGADCATGFCVDGVCCESECSGECDKCRGEIPGQCRPQACGNFGCHDDKTCRERCTESRHCLDGFQCVDGDCVTPPDIRVIDPGCACHLAGSRTANPWWLLLALAVPLGRRRR